MKKRWLLAALVGALTLLVAGQSFAAPQKASGEASRKIVVFQSWVNEAAYDEILAHTGAVKIKNLRLINAAVVLAGRASERALRERAEVLRVEDDAVVYTQAKPQPAPPPEVLPWGVDRIDADRVWDKYEPYLVVDPGANVGAGVKVGVLDTGIDLDHPDLQAIVKGGINTVNPVKSADDDNGHGTHVAGIIGALDNGQGVVGVAPGARLWAVRVLDNNGVGTWSSVICGIDWVTANAGTIEIANMSLGGGGSDDGNCGLSNNDVLHQAICRSVARGVVYVAAAGNNGVDAAGFVPAAYDEVVTVSALADYDGQPGGEGRATCANYGGDDTLASFSNYGADVDIAAPGACIRSTYRGGGYATMSGTSMASPHIAGVVALYLTATGANPENAEGVAAVRAAITNPANGYSVAQGDPRGFGGDRDAYPEPLAYVGAAASPLSVGGLAVAPDPFSPNGDGVRDAATISFNLSGAADWSVTVGDRTWSGSASGATTVSVTWDGTTQTVTMNVP